VIRLSSRKLHVLSDAIGRPFVARVTTNERLPLSMRGSEVLLLDSWTPSNELDGFRGLLLRNAPEEATRLPPNTVVLPPELAYVSDGDVLRISPQDRALAVLYRRRAAFNALLVTERCNHLCLMCSQPPKAADDSHLVDVLLSAIPLFAQDSPEICLTGGEPTLLGPRFLALVRAMRNYLPRTALHVLSNGRSFSDLQRARELAAIAHPDLMIGIPLYGATSELHEYVVQSAGAFDETIRGILNLKRAGVRVELRVVIQRANFEHLPQLAEYVARNLTFLDHVALMGLEPTGFAKANLDSVWIDPVEYKAELKRAVLTIAQAGMRVSVYNHQLCTLDPGLWRYARQSISDWKNEYLAECEGCAMKHRCGGFFSTGVPVRSKYIRALTHAPPR